MTAAGQDVPAAWRARFAEVPRELFIPDTIWIVDETDETIQPLSKASDPAGWGAAVAANEPILTQVKDGQQPTGKWDWWPSSSCSQPSLVAEMLDALGVEPGHRVLEIGTGTGWNAALLCYRVGAQGQVVTVEIDSVLAETARANLTRAGYAPLVITGDGAEGYADAAPFDRIIATAAIREVVPVPWLDQLRPGGRLIAPWETDWSDGVMLTLVANGDGTYTGKFSGDLAFMRLRQQRVSLYGWSPSEDEISLAATGTTECRGSDMDRMLNPAKGNFAIGAKVADCFRYIAWDKHGPRHHILELDDGHTRSWARLDWNVDNPAPFTVYQLGPRKLWDEVEAAYDWWYEQGEPTMDRFGLTIDENGGQWLWLDEPDNVVRLLTSR